MSQSLPYFTQPVVSKTLTTDSTLEELDFVHKILQASNPRKGPVEQPTR
jgi:hypothetical protein